MKKIEEDRSIYMYMVEEAGKQLQEKAKEKEGRAFLLLAIDTNEKGEYYMSGNIQGKEELMARAFLEFF